MKSPGMIYTLLLPALAAMTFTMASAAAHAEPGGEIHVDVPVVLKQAKVVFNMDHQAFSGDTPVGLAHMTIMVERFKQNRTDWKIAAIFHGDAGYMLLNDEAYNVARKTRNGNPYKGLVANLIAQGVDIEECAVTMKGNKWNNDNLLPGIKVNSGADSRIIELEQQGYVMLQP